MIFTIILSLEGIETTWRSSSIALLFHGLSGWTKRELDIRSMAEMERKARGLHAILEKDDVGRMVFRKANG